MGANLVHGAFFATEYVDDAILLFAMIFDRDPALRQKAAEMLGLEPDGRGVLLHLEVREFLLHPNEKRLLRFPARVDALSA